jgi:hypothetical protein
LRLRLGVVEEGPAEAKYSAEAQIMDTFPKFGIFQPPEDRRPRYFEAVGEFFDSEKF